MLGVLQGGQQCTELRSEGKYEKGKADRTLFYFFFSFLARIGRHFTFVLFKLSPTSLLISYVQSRRAARNAWSGSRSRAGQGRVIDEMYFEWHDGQW